MITHNMRDAILHGNRLIMMWEGRVVLDIQRRGKEASDRKRSACSSSRRSSGEQFANDQALLG